MKIQLVKPACFNQVNCEECKGKCAYYKTAIESITQEGVSKDGMALYRVTYCNGLEELIERPSNLLVDAININNFLEEEEEIEDEPEEIEVEDEYEEEEEYPEEVEVEDDEDEYEEELPEEVEVEEEYENNDLLEIFQGKLECEYEVIERLYELFY